MYDFYKISTRSLKRGTIEIYPKFIINNRTKDLMIRGSDFYAIWMEERNLWSRDEQDVIDEIDKDLYKYYEANKEKFQGFVDIKYMRDADSGMINAWHTYCQKQMRDVYVQLDNKLIFGNQETTKTDYASRKLNYPLEKGECNSYEELISTLYSDEERHKIEWAIGAIVTGASKKIEHFTVMYGPPGSGKGTVIKIVQKLFAGYCTTFDAGALGSSKADFATSQFKDNPVVAICPDADLSKMDKNTTLNSLTSHEEITINEKYKSQYTLACGSWLFMGTNEPVNITSAKSGMMRRVIDVIPAGNKIPSDKYKHLMSQIKFELGAIAYHCKEVFESDPKKYEDYVPTRMIRETNDFYDYVLENYEDFKENDGVSLKVAWERYKNACEENNVDAKHRLSKAKFQAELGSYFDGFEERHKMDNGIWIRSYFIGFKSKLFDNKDLTETEDKEKTIPDWLNMVEQESIFDKECSECPAQLASEEGTPLYTWSKVKTKLKDIDTHLLHYVRTPIELIAIDFDLKDENGNKSKKLNLEAASKFPPTYAEFSKSGEGLHLEYYYDGDPTLLNRLYDKDIEIKVFTGKSSLRRKLSKCNNLPIAHISSGLPIREEKKVIAEVTLTNESSLRKIIKKNLNKEYHASTASSISFINKVLEDAYNSDMKYDVSDMYSAVLAFAAGSTHQAANCIKLVEKMHFKSVDASEAVEDNNELPIAFFDVEVFPNLFLVNWKKLGAKNVNRMINPKSEEINNLIHNYRLVGFNCRKYDNHMLYARIMGETNMQLYKRSQLIINSDKKLSSKGGFFREAYNLSYTDIYDYTKTKQSLKKWEIQLGIHHQELGIPWDQPVPESKWIEVAEYCDNDVISTEAVWEATKPEFMAREILVKLCNILSPGRKSTVNDPTNTLTGRLIFRNDDQARKNFIYTDLRTGIRSDGTVDPCHWDGYRWFKDKSGSVHSYLISDEELLTTLKDQQHAITSQESVDEMDEYVREGKVIELSEGGLVIADFGIYNHIVTKDVRSMHPHSVIALNLFGPYTKNFADLVNLRVYVKKRLWDKARNMFDGALKEIIPEEGLSDDKATQLADALKIAINAVYGLTSAKFDNAFTVEGNADNIVAKRGQLFMATLRAEVLKHGGTPIHIKTDSIKLVNPTNDILDFVDEYGEKYGYFFDIEARYERLALVNKSVYIAKYENDSEKHGGEWTATGEQFAVPYVFKSLFSHEDIVFRDLCETKSVQNSAIYLDMSNGEDLDHLKFVGRVGLFTPIKPGCGGGTLLRTTIKKDGSVGYDSVNGTKGYQWLESEEVEYKHKEADVDYGYYNALVDDAIDAINEYGDFHEFANGKVDEKLNYKL